MFRKTAHAGAAASRATGLAELKRGGDALKDLRSLREGRRVESVPTPERAVDRGRGSAADGARGGRSTPQGSSDADALLASLALPPATDERPELATWRKNEIRWLTGRTEELERRLRRRTIAFGCTLAASVGAAGGFVVFFLPMAPPPAQVAAPTSTPTVAAAARKAAPPPVPAQAEPTPSRPAVLVAAPPPRIAPPVAGPMGGVDALPAASADDAGEQRARPPDPEVMHQGPPREIPAKLEAVDLALASLATASPSPSLAPSPGAPPAPAAALFPPPERVAHDPQPPAARVMREPLTGIELVPIAAGCFRMGDRDVGIIDQVCVDPFLLGRTEITNAQFRRFRPDHRSGRYDGYSLNGDDQPVVNVSWRDAVAFAQWLSARTQLRFRLPTEAEWEYAARAGTGTAWFWGVGAEDAFNYANLKDLPGTGLRGDGYVVTAPVAYMASNPFGVSDLLGNASEWVEDSYVPGAGRYHGTLRNPRVSDLGAMRVRRGGSFDDPLRIVGCSSRDFYAADLGVPQTGFRLVMER